MAENLLIRLLKAEERRLDQVISDSHFALQKLSGLPDGNVEIKRHNKSVQFYLREDPHAKHGVYMPASKRKTAQAIIQKNYLAKIVSVAENQIHLIQKFIKTYDPDCLKKVFMSLGEERRKIVEPVEFPDDLFVKKWLQTEYEHKKFIDGSPEHYTLNHERVRSKSEVLIADALFTSGIPYKYECPLTLSEKTIYPDFTILRTCERKEIYWEHLGLMDDSDYRNHALKRIRDYEAHGIFPGDSLIITMETYKLPLSRNVINSMIKHFL